MKWRTIAILSLIGLVLCFATAIVLWFGPAGAEFRNANPPAVVLQVKRLKQLATVKYTVQRVVGLTEQKTPIGEESLLLMVQGEVTAGVDLSSFSERDVQAKGKAIVICLPKATIFDTFLDEKKTRVWDHHVTWWTPWVSYDPDLEHRARLSAVEEIRAAALSMGILNQSEQSAQAAIRQVFEALGIKVDFENNQHS